MKEENHFQWPDPTRNDLMYLQTIGNQSRLRSITQDYKYNTNESKKTFFNKECFINRIEDIQTKNFKKEIVRESLHIDDIYGVRPNINKFKTNRECNPIEPTYRLPTYTPAEPPQPNKFIRDTLNITDIQGTQPKIKINQPRNVDPYTFIEGSKAKQQKQRYIQMEINEQRKSTNRHLDPLQPRYKWGDEIIGPVQGSISTIRNQDFNKIKSLSLQTQDIKGAQSDTLRRKPLTFDKTTNNTQDIYRAQADTVQRGMSTKRQTNPLQPSYQLLGATQLYNI